MAAPALMHFFLGLELKSLAEPCSLYLARAISRDLATRQLRGLPIPATASRSQRHADGTPSFFHFLLDQTSGAVNEMVILLVFSRVWHSEAGISGPVLCTREMLVLAGLHHCGSAGSAEALRCRDICALLCCGQPQSTRLTADKYAGYSQASLLCIMPRLATCRLWLNGSFSLCSSCVD